MGRKRGFTPDDVYLVRRLSDPQVSPDGRRIAYVVAESDRESDSVRTYIEVAPTDGSRPARRFTHGGRDHYPRWSPDGRFLAFVSDRGKKGQIHLAPLDGGEAEAVTEAEHGVLHPAWSPDGRRLAYVSRVGPAPDRKAGRVVRHLRSRLDGIGWFDDRRLHLFVTDLAGGEPVQVTEGDWHDEQPAWSPDGRLLAFVSDRTSGRFETQFASDLYVVPSGGGRARKLTRSRGAVSAPVFSPDGRLLAFAGHEHGEAGNARHSHAFVLGVDGGALRSVSAPLDRPVAMLPPGAGGTVAWTGDGSGVLFLANDRGAVRLFRGAVEGRPRPLTGADREVAGFSVAARSGQLAYVAGWADDPQEVYGTGREGRGERRVSDVHAGLRAEVDFGRAARVTCRAPDGWEIESVVVTPPDAEEGDGRRRGAGGARPGHLVVHGGPHGYHPWSFQFAAYQASAGAGYVTLLPNPRGSTGYGEEFQTACVADWGGADFDDLMAATDALAAGRDVDPERLYVSGYSYGGFMTTWIVGHTARFRAAVVGAPVSNQVSMIGTSDIPRFTAFEMGGLPWERPEVYAKRSPVTYLDNCTTPVLLLHREGDLRTPVGQAEEVFAGLKLLGREVEMVRYPGGSHGMRAPSHEADEQRRTLEWFAAH